MQLTGTAMTDADVTHDMRYVDAECMPELYAACLAVQNYARRCASLPGWAVISSSFGLGVPSLAGPGVPASLPCNACHQLRAEVQ